MTGISVDMNMFSTPQGLGTNEAVLIEILCSRSSQVRISSFLFPQNGVYVEIIYNQRFKLLSLSCNTNNEMKSAQSPQKTTTEETVLPLHYPLLLPLIGQECGVKFLSQLQLKVLLNFAIDYRNLKTKSSLVTFHAQASVFFSIRSSHI